MNLDSVWNIMPDLADLSYGQQQKLNACSYRLESNPNMLNYVSYHGSYAAHAPFWINMELTHIRKNGTLTDISPSICNCMMYKEGKSIPCGKDKYCSLCASFKSQNRSIAAMSRIPYSKLRKFLHLTYSFNSNQNLAEVNCETIQARLDEAKTYLSSLLLLKHIDGYVFGEELYISNIQQQAGLLHVHAVITYQGENLFTLVDDKYIPALHLLPTNSEANIYIKPIESEQQYKTALKYLVKSIDFARQYTSELKEDLSNVHDLNTALHNMINRYHYLVGSRHRYGSAGVYRKKRQVSSN